MAEDPKMEILVEYAANCDVLPSGRVNGAELMSGKQRSSKRDGVDGHFRAARVAALLCILAVPLTQTALSDESVAGQPLRQRVYAGQGAAQRLDPAEDQPILRTGAFGGRRVTYKIVGEFAVYEGDIILGKAVDLEASAGGPGTAGIGITYGFSLWPNVGGVYQIPYINTGAPGNVDAAVSMFNATFSGQIQFVPQTTETDYVNFNLDPNDMSGGCYSSVGRVGGTQIIGGSAACSAPGLLHEMGHAIGLWHEQSRSDRDTFINILYNNVIKFERPNFDQVFDNAQSIGLFDYASIMEYFPASFSKNGEPTIESIPAGIRLSNSAGYTAGDVDMISRIYSFATSNVTITSNPPGLQVIVDGMTITTPQTFGFALNSTHTLDIPTGAQTQGNSAFIYGRWNDNPAASHTITIAPGDGRAVSPINLPAVTVYSASFIELVPYTQSVFPDGSGTILATPPPASYPPAPGVYYAARQPVAFQATPSDGNTFYAWGGLDGSFSANPKTSRYPGNVVAYFTNAPVTTITSNPPERWLSVDGTFYFGPVNFSTLYDPTWTPGSMHTVNVSINPQLPYSFSIRYAFSSWSDGGAQSHMITLPGTSSVVSASFAPQYNLSTFVNEFCAGAISVVPTSADNFYNPGTQLTFTETPNTGWILTGWQGDLSGTTNPQMLTVADEMLVGTDFNTTSNPLSVSGFSPPNAIAGGSAFTLTINGTGFTPDSIVFVNGIFRQPSFVSSTQLTVQVTQNDIATVGALQVGVSNFPQGAGCSAFQSRPFFVLSPSM